MARSRGSWTKAKLAYLEDVQAVLEELGSWWPVTLRQVYYRLVAAQLIPNTRSAYQKLSNILTHARIDGRVSWDALEDRGRRKIGSSGWRDAEEFVRDETAEFLAGYRRDLLTRQDHAIEIWIEKDALAEVALRAARPLCVPVVVARGFSSVSYLHEFRERVISHQADRKHVTKILYFGDLDPSGWGMLPAMMTTLRDELGLGDRVQGVRCALTPEQVAAWGLPFGVDALKETDSRYAGYVRWLEEQGADPTMAVELDALPPGDLEDLVRKSILRELDEEQLDRDAAEEQHELRRLQGLRERVVHAIGGASW